MYKLPFALSFAPRNPLTPKVPAYKPGRGEAGWTMGEFASREQALAFMAQHPEAEMPCWARVRSGEV